MLYIGIYIYREIFEFDGPMNQLWDFEVLWFVIHQGSFCLCSNPQIGRTVGHMEIMKDISSGYIS